MLTLRNIPLSRDDREHLARILNAWPKQPVIVIGETWVEGSQGFGGVSRTRAYLRVLYEALGEMLELAGVPVGRPVSDETGGPPPYAHLSRIDQSFLAEVASRLGVIAMVTPTGVIFRAMNPVTATPLVGLIGRGIDYVSRSGENGIVISKPRSTRI